MAQPLSTSSFEESSLLLPAGAAMRSFAGALAFTLVLLVAWEFSLQQLAHAKTSPKRPGLEAAARLEQVAATGGARVFVLGSSRVASGLSPQDFAEQYGQPVEVACVSIPGGSSAQMLHASQASFQEGDVVICEVWPIAFFEGKEAPDLQDFTAGFSYPWMLDGLERELRTALESRFAAFGPDGDPVDRLRQALRDTVPVGIDQPPDAEWAHIIEHENGWSEARLVVTDRAKWDERARQHAPRPSTLSAPALQKRFSDVLDTLLEDVESIRERGATVLFVRMPATGINLQREEAAYPAQHCWARLESTFPGSCLDFRDDDVMRELWAPDGSHLESDGARIFSRRLATWVKSRPQQ